MNTIGLLGAGVMGTAAGTKILEAGYKLTVFDPTAAAQNWAKEVGASVAQSLDDVAREAKIILMFLPGPVQIKQCVTGEKGILNNPGECRYIVDLATSDPTTTREMAETCKTKGIGYLDAPILGRPSAVGKWCLPVGGCETDLNSCRSILELFASSILYIGDSGAGHTIKLLNQMMFGAINAMTAEMIAIASGMGFDPSLVVETITSSQAGTVSNLFKELGNRIIKDDYSAPTFSVDLLIKDINLGLKMAQSHGTPPLLGQVVSYLNETARSQGHGSMDTAIMWKAVKSMWEPSEKL